MPDARQSKRSAQPRRLLAALAALCLAQSLSPGAGLAGAQSPPDAAGDTQPAAERATNDNVAAKASLSVEAPGVTKTRSTTPDIEAEIRQLDRQILLQLIDLAEFNVRFQKTVNHYARWRALVYPLAQEATYAGFLGYNITDICQRAKGWNNPRLISPTAIKQGLAAATVGSLLGGSSSALELICDGSETLRSRREGFSVKSSVAFVTSTVERVDQLLARRHALMATVPAAGRHKELLELKEELLRYERDRLIFEFKRWSVHSRGYAWYKNTFYVINAAVNFSRFSSTLLGFKTFTNRRFGGSTGPVLIASSILAGLGPPASSAVRDLIERHQTRRLNRVLPSRAVLSDQEAKEKFKRLQALLQDEESYNPKSRLAAELVRLRQEKLGLDTVVYHEEKKIQRIRKVAGLQAKVVPIISLAGTASGVLRTVSYYGYRAQPITDVRLGAAADAALIPAEALALIATPGASIIDYLYERNLKKRGEHPDQLLSQRLKNLNTLKQIVSQGWQ